MELSNWYTAVPCILGNGILPVITFFFFCRYCSAAFSWAQCGAYVMLSAGFKAVQIWFKLPGSLGLLGEIGLLGLCGALFLKRKGQEALSMAVLLMCMLSVTNGMVGWLDRQMTPLILAHEPFIPPSDGVREVIKAVFLIGLYMLVLKRFGRSMGSGDRHTLMQLSVPVLFIALVERIIKTAVYGDVLVVDYETLQVLPAADVNHVEILFLQLWACVCLFMVLFSYERITDILYEHQNDILLRQRFAEQEVYVQEAQLRYKQTSSFRHDIKNHLTVVAELLRAGRTEEACGYLDKLEQVSSSLSFPVQTGNAVVDALLGSKLSAAKERKIQVEWDMKIPEDSRVSHMDWCVVLANGLDNAMKGCECLQEEQRFIRLTGKRKGNFYLLMIENSCDRNMGKVPEDGTGLANIRAVVKKNHGTMENTVSQGVYRLKLLFVDMDGAASRFTS